MIAFENNGRHIATIVENHPCDAHNRKVGQPCYTLFNSFQELAGVCGRRIAARYDGQITPVRSASKN